MVQKLYNSTKKHESYSQKLTGAFTLERQWVMYLDVVEYKRDCRDLVNSRNIDFRELSALQDVQNTRLSCCSIAHYHQLATDDLQLTQDHCWMAV